MNATRKGELPKRVPEPQFPRHVVKRTEAKGTNMAPRTERATPNTIRRPNDVLGHSKDTSVTATTNTPAPTQAAMAKKRHRQFRA